MSNFNWNAYKPYVPEQKRDEPPKKTNFEKQGFNWGAYRQPKEQDQPEKQEEESFLKSSARTALQIPQGIAEVTPPGIAASLFQLLAAGETDLSPEEWNKLRGMYEEKGIDFDEAYEEGRRQVLGSIPTVSNIASKIEQETGIPLEPKNKYQHATRVLSGIGTVAGPRIAPKTKPSGLPERGFEKLKTSREVPEAKLTKINEKLESDFKKLSDNIIKESPIGETAKNLAENPAFKQESIAVLEEARELANEIKQPINSTEIKDAFTKAAKKQKKGFLESEYDKKYNSYMNEAASTLEEGEVSATQLLDQYRKNNEALGEYFEPGSSKALNRAKKDSLLDQNRAIADVMGDSFPDSELSKVFKEGNQRWSKIMDVEAVDSFVEDAFKGGINYKKMRDLFDKKGYDRVFKRALGEEKYKDFTQLVEDMLKSEKPYKMLKAAKEKGYNDLAKTAMGYIIHPKFGLAKGGFDIVKTTYRTLMNSMLDKPQLMLKWKSGIFNLKKGKFKEAEKDLKALEAGEIQGRNPESNAPPLDTKKQEALRKFKNRRSKLIGNEKEK